jgi:hypothetical protein
MRFYGMVVVAVAVVDLLGRIRKSLFHSRSTHCLNAQKLTRQENEWGNDNSKTV